MPLSVRRDRPGPGDDDRCAVAVKDGSGPQKAYKDAPSVCLTTDAGMGFTLVELDTAVKYKSH